MIYRILKDGQEVNTIVADLGFTAAYCEKNGYTFVEVPEPEPESEETAEPTVWDELDAAYREGVNGAYDQ